jgi:hypothetical protein
MTLFFRQLYLEQAQCADQPMQNVAVIPFVAAQRTLTSSMADLARQTPFDQ